jgi:hypothetical protein
MTNHNIDGASHPKQIAPNAFVVGRSSIQGERQHAAEWCQLAITGDCFEVGAGSGRPGVVTSTGDAVLICARGREIVTLESFEVGWEYRLYGRLVEKQGEWNGREITKRFFNLLPAAPGI